MRGLRKRQHGDMRVRLRSIDADAAFVTAIAALYPRFPLYANLRHGAWYAPRFAGAAYFKSTDGHAGQWDFSLGRLNLHAAAAAADAGGLLLIDSTRSGKTFPDALSVTVPVWCAVINRVLGLSMPSSTSPGAQSECGGKLDAVYLPPWVSPSEVAQIEARVDDWVERVSRVGSPTAGGGSDGSRSGDGEVIAALRRRLMRPLRPLWIGQERAGWDAARRRLRPDRVPLPFEESEALLQQGADELLRAPAPHGGDGSMGTSPPASPASPAAPAAPHSSPPPFSPPFIPVVCVSASDPRPAAELRGSYSFAYIQGAGDDHENWASVLLERGQSSSGGEGGEKAEKPQRAMLEPAQFWANHVELLGLAGMADGWTGDGALEGDADFGLFEALVRDVLVGARATKAVVGSGAGARSPREAVVAATVRVTDSLVMVPVAPLLACLRAVNPAATAAAAGEASASDLDATAATRSPWRQLGFQFDAVLNCADWACCDGEGAADKLWTAAVNLTGGAMRAATGADTSEYYCAAPVVGGKRGLRRQGRHDTTAAARGAAAAGTPRLPPSAFSHWQRCVLPRAFSFLHEHTRRGLTCAVVYDVGTQHIAVAASEGAAGAATVVLAALLALYGTQQPAAASIDDAEKVEEGMVEVNDAQGRWSIPMVPRTTHAICSTPLRVTKEAIRRMQARLQLVAPLACPPRRLLKQLTTFFIAPPVGTVGCGWEWWQAALRARFEHCDDT